MKRGRHRHHRLRQHQPGLSEGGESFPDPRDRRARRPQPRGRRSARGTNSACRRVASRPCSPTPRSRSSLNLTMPESACRGRPAGDRRGQARPFGKAARRHRRRGAQADRGGARPRACASAARPTRSSAARIRPARKLIDEGRSAGRSAARPSSCARAMSAGIPIPASTTSPAAARCSTWAPTTSPPSSICSGPVASVARHGDAPAARARRSPASR